LLKKGAFFVFPCIEYSHTYAIHWPRRGWSFPYFYLGWNAWTTTKPSTVSVDTAVFFSLDLGFFCFIWGSGVFTENLGFFDSGQILEIYVVLLYFSFNKNTVESVGSSVE